MAQAQIRQAIAANPQIGRDWPTVNPLVLECNDGYLNDIQAMAVTEADYFNACANVTAQPEQGAVGAGRGMSCFGLKGGIGSASRIARQETELAGSAPDYTVGALVLSNFGKLRHLRVNGRMLGQDIKRRMAGRHTAAPVPPDIAENAPDKGPSSWCWQPTRRWTPATASAEHARSCRAGAHRFELWPWQW
ncbi:peptidase S58, DmpA [Advenella kashmirensis WT001]|uniref:Peptidase S58, DmpA n=1 Tax=Advenella kashmirensis (strain DSM 17095 / LMG 22695 / WT001) TaxID=1036672 RepID=I3U8J9_ADVKW|nr:peptidase S58, DmpA [Advenella kashmirensis WT001]